MLTTMSISLQADGRTRRPPRRRAGSPGAPPPYSEGVMSTANETEPWQPLLDLGRTDDRLVHDTRASGAAARIAPIPSSLSPIVANALHAAGIDQLYTHQAEAVEAALRRTDDRHHRHRLGQVALLSDPDARGADQRSDGAGAVPVPDQVAGPGPGPVAGAVRTAPRGPPRDLRRRHPPPGADRDPAQVQPRDHQPRHAPRRDPAPPRRLAGAVLEPALRRRRRGPRVPRRVRLACRPTCSGGYDGSPRSMAPIRGS